VPPSSEIQKADFDYAADLINANKSTILYRPKVLSKDQEKFTSEPASKASYQTNTAA